jgi:GNAT superfamily N-acetyltransferase
MFSDIGGRTPRELAAHDRVYGRWARERMHTGELRAFIVEDPEGRAVGSGAIWLQPQQPRPGRLARRAWPYIMSMYTEPAFRGRGVASRLVDVMVRWATAHGYPRMFLHASKMGRTVYARAGFLDGNEMRLDLPARRSPRRGR